MPREGTGVQLQGSSRQSFLFYLRNIHDRVTAEGPGRGKIIGAQQGGDDPILINASDHGAIHEVNQPRLVHRDAWEREAKTGSSALEAVTSYMLGEPCRLMETLRSVI